ncbi:MAG: nucleoside triphosphate pyrophosphohydrolase family protein, partial [Reinekea sp.]|nr:nucleoside triphosphate pyrophosphohydrolase family protein [Reinekea sp.]
MKQQLIEKVREFREAFGFSQPEEAIHYKLTLEETDELIDAFIEPEPLMRLIEVADALADRVFTSCGGIIDGCDMHHYLEKTITWAERFNIDLPRAVDAVFVSNMSKLCSKSEIKPTADKYAAIGVDVRFEP